MRIKKIPKLGAILFIFIYGHGIINTETVAGELKAKSKQIQQIGNNDNEFIFAGRCINGESYRIYSYEKNIDGHSKSFYDFEGPVGKGTVMTNASPKTLAERICRQTAEIADGS